MKAYGQVEGSSFILFSHCFKR